MSRGAALCALGSVRICISVICFLSTITQKHRRHMVAVLRHKRKTKAERRIRSPSPREPPPSPREGPGRGPYFFNTEDTNVTENHPAHFDNTDAASQQLMTRNLRTHITGHQNSACPTARASPAPWGGPGRGPICVKTTVPTQPYHSYERKKPPFCRRHPRLLAPCFKLKHVLLPLESAAPSTRISRSFYSKHQPLKV